MFNFYKSIDRYTDFEDTEIFGNIDTETTGSYLHHDDRMFFLSITVSKAIILHPKLMNSVTGKPLIGNVFSWEWPVDPFTRQPSIPEADLAIVHDVLLRRDITWSMHNAIFDVGVLCKEIDMDPIKLLSRVHDTMLMSHAYNSYESHGAKDLGIKYLGIADTDQKDLKAGVNGARAVAGALGWKIASKENLPMHNRSPKTGWWVIDMWLPREVARFHEYDKRHSYWTLCSKYANTDTLRGLGLFFGYSRMLKQHKLWDRYMENRVSLIPCFSMQYEGLNLHADRATKLQAGFNKIRERIEKPLASSIGKRFFRPNSVDNIRLVLYGDFQLPVVFTTKKGNPSTGKDVLTDIIKKYGPSKRQLEKKTGLAAFRPPVQQDVEKYSDYRRRLDDWSNGLQGKECLFHFAASLLMWKKLRSTSTTINSYLTKLVGKTLHPRYNPTGTHSTRLSSSDPNGQNISKGKLAFIEFLFDYSLSLRDVFGPDEGDEWWSVDYKQVELVTFAYLSQDQKMLKAIEDKVDFHTIMARVIFNLRDDETPTDAQRTLAKNINFGFIYGAGPAKIERTAHMPGLWDRLVRSFSGATAFIEKNSREVLKHGFVECAGGYRLFVPEDKPYAGTNYKIQGTAGIIMKRAMIGVYDYLQRAGRPLKLIASIHDELLLQGKRGAGFNCMYPVCDVMRDAAMSVGIPIEVDADYISDSWGDGHSVTWKDECPFITDETVMKRLIGA